MVIIFLTFFLIDWKIYLYIIFAITLSEIIILIFNWLSKQLNDMVLEYEKISKIEEGKQE